MSRKALALAATPRWSGSLSPLTRWNCSRNSGSLSGGRRLASGGGYGRNSRLKKRAVLERHLVGEIPPGAVTVQNHSRPIDRIFFEEHLDRVFDEFDLVGNPAGDLSRLGRHKNETAFVAERLPILEHRGLHRITAGMQPDEKPVFEFGIVVLGDVGPEFVLVSGHLVGKPAGLEVFVGQVFLAGNDRRRTQIERNFRGEGRSSA